MGREKGGLEELARETGGKLRFGFMKGSVFKEGVADRAILIKDELVTLIKSNLHVAVVSQLAAGRRVNEKKGPKRVNALRNR